MPIIPNANPSGLVATGRDDTGYATVLDRPHFDPVAFSAELRREKANQIITDKKLQLERGTANRRAIASLTPQPAWQKYQKNYEDFIDNSTKVLSEIESQGGYIENSPEMAKTESRLNALEKADAEAKTLYNQANAILQKGLRDGRYEPEEVIAWQEKFNQTKDPEEGIAFLTEPTNFPKEPFRPLDVLDTKYFPKSTTYENAQGVTTVTPPNQEALDLYLDATILQGDPQVARDYERGKAEINPDTGKPYWNSFDSYKSFMGEQVLNMSKKGLSRTNPSGGGLNLNIGNGSLTTKDYVLTPTDTTGVGNAYNKVAVAPVDGVRRLVDIGDDKGYIIDYDVAPDKKSVTVYLKQEVTNPDYDGMSLSKSKLPKTIEKTVPIELTVDDARYARLVGILGTDPIGGADDAWGSNKRVAKEAPAKKKLPGT